MARFGSIMSSFMLAAALAAQPACVAAQENVTLFRAARVFDGTSLLENTDVLVRNGVIAEVGRSLSLPAGATLVDAAGKTLLPGLIDAHTHAFGDVLREALVFGVTTELDMFTEPSSAQQLRRQQRAGGAADRADLFSAGVLATAPGGHGTEYGLPIPTITSADSAQAFVDARLAEGSDYLKIVYDDGHVFGLNWPTLSRPVMTALVTATHRRDRLAVVHVSAAAAAREAIEAGADGLVHLFVDTLDENFAALVKQRGAFVIPTLVVLKSVTGTAGGAPLVSDARIEPYLTPSSRVQLEQSFPARGERPYAVAEETVRRLRAAGVPILAGTDAPNPGTSHGAALHRELELLVDAGLSPLEALAAATSVPARAFQLEDRGRIATGLRADLVLVDGDPTKDITATRAIAGVWKAGVLFDRPAYARVVADARAAAESAPEGLERGLISDFESGRAATAFGTEWISSVDTFAGGSSTGEFAVVEGGANGSAGSLRISGTISDKVAYAWSGVMWSPGTQPMQPGDLSSKREVRFFTKGDGRSYSLMVFSQSHGMTPLMREFVAPAEWTEVVIPWTDFGIDGKGVMALVFAGTLPAGPFAFQVDDVHFR